MKTLGQNWVEINSDPDFAELINDFIERYYNRVRIHQSLGYRTPEQFEKMYRGA